MFGLAQLYQLRGRVGRSKLRAYALFTLPANRKLTDTADRRLKVLQSLDSLGAGFQLASHDLDIRGAGNLLGEEQSGHIKEVGFELYQQMLEEAVAEIRGTGEPVDGGWSPQITVGTAVMIPESYVPDLQLRLALYRRLGDLESTEEIDAFGAELIDRFGPLPEEVQHLLKIVFIKALCRQANVEKLDAGPKGVVIHFRKREFADPVGLVRYHRRAGLAGQDQAGPERGLHPRLAERRKAPCGLGGGDDATGAAGGEGGGVSPSPLAASAQLAFSNSPRAFAAATCRMASASVSASCAPITAYLPSSRKHGTPVMPMREAVATSVATASRSASVGEQALDDRRGPCRLRARPRRARNDRRCSAPFSK